MGQSNFLPRAYNDDRAYRMVYIDVDEYAGVDWSLQDDMQVLDSQLAFDDFTSELRSLLPASMDMTGFIESRDEQGFAVNRMVQVSMADAGSSLALVVAERACDEYDDMAGDYNRASGLRARHVELLADRVFDALFDMGYPLRERCSPHMSADYERSKPSTA